MTREKILKYTIIFFALCLLTVSVSFGYSEKNLRQVDQGGVGKKTGIPQMIMGQQPGGGIPGVATQRAVVNIADLARQEALAPLSEKGKTIPPFMPLPHDLVVPTGVETPTEKPPAPEGWLPFKTFAPTSPPPSASFLALGDDGTRIPPDVHGAVGPNHLMVTLNSQVRIQNRVGGVISTVSLQTFWASVGPFSTGIGAFDPKSLYDPYNNRWMFTACADPSAATSSLLIGVSQTSDPTGLWNLYRIDADPTDQVWVDYPSLGFNKDWICVQVNVYNIIGGGFRSDIYVFNKANLYAGGAGLFTLISSAAIGGTQVPAITYDNTLSTLYLLQTWNGNWAGNGYLRLYTITGSVGSELLTPLTFISTPNPWDWVGFTGWNDFAPQLGSAQKIMNNDDRMQNLVYRNGSLWATHTVFLPAGGAATRSAVQWWELTPAGGIIQRARIYEPTGAFYAFPSITVNQFNDVLIGYSRFSATQYASANYSFRAAADPLNTLQADYVLKAGEAPYYKTFGAGLNRWGDFSNTVVDPVNDINMWTIQEYAATPSGGSDRWGTWWGRIDPRGTISGTKFNDANGNCVQDPGEAGLPGWTITLNPGGLATLTDINGNYLFSFLAPNTYTISEVLKPNWQQTCPAPPGTYVVALNPGQTVTGENFGNRAIFMRGDVNADGNINLVDVIYLANYVLKGGPSPIPLASGDVNCDGKYDLVDVIKLARYVLLGEPFPC